MSIDNRLKIRMGEDDMEKEKEVNMEVGKIAEGRTKIEREDKLLTADGYETPVTSLLISCSS